MSKQEKGSKSSQAGRRPALRFWDNLKIWQKLGLIAVVMGLPIPPVAYVLVSEKTKAIDFGSKEIDGAAYLGPVRRLFEHVAQHRGTNSIYARGDKTVKDTLLKLDDVIEDDFKAVDLAGKQDGASGQPIEELLETGARAAEIRRKWEDLKFRELGVPADESYQEHSDIANDILDLISQTGDKSNLTVDPQLESYYLANEVTRQLPELCETMGQIRDIGAGIATVKKKSPDEQADLSFRSGRVPAMLRNLRKGIDASKDQKALAQTSAAIDTAGSFLNLVDQQVLRTNDITIDQKEYYAAGSKPIDQLLGLYDSSLGALEGLLQKRVSQLTQSRNTILGFVIFGVMLTIVLVVLIARGISRQIRSISGLIAQLDRGEVDARAAVLTGDELGRVAASFNSTLDNTRLLMQSKEERDRIQQSIMKLLEEVSGVAAGDLTREAEVTADVTGSIADAFNFMIVELRRIISNVQEVTVQVTSSASRTQTATEELVRGSQQQAEQIANTSKAIDQMYASIQQVSETAAISADVARQSLTTALRGTESVGNTIRAMGRIRDQAQETAKRIKRLGENSQEIGEIVKVIGDIADRTSILALNASIQAAAAGEAGRGFAVVAAEIERLAERSTEATKRVGNLVKAVQLGTSEAIAAVEKSTREVVQGSDLANQAGQALNEIRLVSDQLADLIQTISAAAREQAQGSETVARSMSGISEITRRTADGIKQSAVVVDDLAGLAGKLGASVASFKLPQNAGNGASSAAGNGRRRDKPDTI
jgi:methyl-accepting chemotaxis protein